MADFFKTCVCYLTSIAILSYVMFSGCYFRVVPTKDYFVLLYDTDLALYLVIVPSVWYSSRHRAVGRVREHQEPPGPRPPAEIRQRDPGRTGNTRPAQSRE